MPNADGFTRTESDIHQLLSDGLPHSYTEIRKCLWDEMATKSVIQMHISNLRKKVQAKGMDILPQFINRVFHYRMVRLLASPYKE